MFSSKIFKSETFLYRRCYFFALDFLAEKVWLVLMSRESYWQMYHDFDSSPKLVGLLLAEIFQLKAWESLLSSLESYPGSLRLEVYFPVLHIMKLIQLLFFLLQHFSLQGLIALWCTSVQVNHHNQISLLVAQLALGNSQWLLDNLILIAQLLISVPYITINTAFYHLHQ